MPGVNGSTNAAILHRGHFGITERSDAPKMRSHFLFEFLQWKP